MRRLHRYSSTLSLSYAGPVFNLVRAATETNMSHSKAALPAPAAAVAAPPAPAAPLPPLPKHPLVGVHNFRDVGTSVYVPPHHSHVPRKFAASAPSLR